MRSPMWTVARREVVERIRQRGFQVSTLVTLLIVAALAVIPGLISDDGIERFDVAVVGADSRTAVAAAASAAGAADDIRINPVDADDRAAAERLLRDESAAAAVIDGRSIVTLEDLPPELEQALQTGSQQARTTARLEAEGLRSAQIEEVLAPEPLPTTSLENTEGEDANKGIAFALTLLLYGQLLTYGLWVATGVVEEKASRVIEILLAAIAPRDLLRGKVVGLGVLAFAQLMLTVIVGAALARVSGVLDVSTEALATIGVVLLWFPLGYALYACLYAAAGALVSRQEDIQSTTTPLTIFMVAGYLVSFQAIEDPGGTLATVASLIPLFAPLLMPVRMALGEAPLPEILAALVVLVASIALVIGLGTRIYERSVLRMGKPVRWLEALRSPAR